MGRLALVSCALLAMCSIAAARPAASGWYTEGDLGATAFLPRASNFAAVGPSLDIRFGRDLLSFLSLGILVAASSHEATVTPPPRGDWFQLYRGGAEVRIGGRLDRIALYLEGGVGVALISTNVLGKEGITAPGEDLSLVFQAGAGFEYQLENRHYALGLGGDFFLVPQFDSIKAIDTHAYLRYTY